MSPSPSTRSLEQARAELTGWFEPVVSAAGYDLEELAVRSAGQRSVVRVVVDRDSGVSLDDVADVSHVLSEVLDSHDDAMGPAYVLEVTSPGVDRPLTLPRHWRRNAGRLVSVLLTGGETVLGRLAGVDDGGVVLAVEKAGAKKGQVRKAAGERRLGWAELAEGRVQVEFNRPAGHRDAGLVHTGPADDEHDDALDDEHDDADQDDADQDDLLDDEQDEGRPAPEVPAARDRGEQ